MFFCVRLGRKDAASVDEIARLPTFVESSCDRQQSPRLTFDRQPNVQSSSLASVIQPLIQPWDLVKGQTADNNANPTNPKLLIANNRICGRRSPSVVLLTKLTLCVILNLLVSSCSFLLLRWIAKFITERQCDRVELDLHANRAIRMSIQSIAMHYMCL